MAIFTEGDEIWSNFHSKYQFWQKKVVWDGCCSYKWTDGLLDGLQVGVKYRAAYAANDKDRTTYSKCGCPLKTDIKHAWVSLKLKYRKKTTPWPTTVWWCNIFSASTDPHPDHHRGKTSARERPYFFFTDFHLCRGEHWVNDHQHDHLKDGVRDIIKQHSKTYVEEKWIINIFLMMNVFRGRCMRKHKRSNFLSIKYILPDLLN